jgi:hypothetical protein
MTEQESSLKTLLKSKGITSNNTDRFKKFTLSFNPFPRSGISDLNSSDYIISKLEPIDPEVKAGINEFVIDSLFPNNPNSTDNYLSTVIRGEYGYGKTQTLLYAKYLLDSFKEEKEYHKNPYVVYIDTPGAKLTELIGSIISQIGDENFKRYLWNIVIDKIAKDTTIKAQLLEFLPRGYSLFGTDDVDPFSQVNTVNYKNFLDGWLKYLNQNPKKKKEFQDLLKTHIISIFTTEFENATVSLYFYELLSENIGINKTWEILTSGNAKDLDKKEVYIIRAIGKLIQTQGFTDFYILVDEFEAVTAGRLTPAEIDRYVTNLRALIDKERNWCSLFAMTGFALSRLKGVSPPLAERISGRIIDLKPLNLERAKIITSNYLNLARETPSNSILPFNEEGLQTLRDLSNGILRVFLKSCFSLIQRAVEELQGDEEINQAFVSKHFQIEEE